MKFRISGRVVSLCLCLAMLATRRVSASCANLSGTVSSTGINANPDFVWATNIDNLSFRFQLSVAYPCAANNSNFAIRPLSLELSFTDRPNSSFASLRLRPDDCSVLSVAPFPSYFSNASISCIRTPNNSDVALTVTLMNPSTRLNGSQVSLKVPDTSNQTDTRTQPIVIRNCPLSIGNPHLQLYTASGYDAATGDYQFGARVGFRCKNHGLVLTKNKSQIVEPDLRPSAVCGPMATWVYDSAICWPGHSIIVNANRSATHHEVPLARRLLLMCHNDDATKIATVQLKVGNRVGRVDKTLSWLNVSIHDYPTTQQHVAVQCIHNAPDGKVVATVDLQLTLSHKRVHISKHAPIHHTVYVGSSADVRLPLSIGTPLKRNHVHIKKEGASKPFTTFNVVRSSNPHQQIIELLFKKVAAEDLGTYILKFSTSRDVLYVTRFVLDGGALSTGVKVGVALTVVISCVIIIAVIGYIVRKYIKHKKELSDDDQRVLIIEDNEDIDDVFHDPSRSARIQEELLRDQNSLGTSVNPNGNLVQSVPEQNGDKVSIHSEQSECFILDETNNEVTDAKEAEE